MQATVFASEDKQKALFVYFLSYFIRELINLHQRLVISNRVILYNNDCLLLKDLETNQYHNLALNRFNKSTICWLNKTT